MRSCPTNRWTRRSLLRSAGLIGCGAISRPAWADRPWATVPKAPVIEPYIQLSPESSPCVAVERHGNGALVGLLRDSSKDAGRIAIVQADRSKRLSTADAQVPFLMPGNVRAITKASDGAIWAVGHLSTSSADLALFRLGATQAGFETVTRLDHALLTRNSAVSAIAVSGRHAYLSDAGAPALITVDISTGKGSRVLENDPSLRGRRATVIGGMPQRAGSRLKELDVAILALSPDGAWLYYQPPCGPLYRLGTALLTDPAVDTFERQEGMAEWRDTPTLGGIATGEDGTLYMTDVANGRILSFSTARIPLCLAVDHRLASAFSPTLDDDGALLVPVADGPAILRLSPLPH